MTATFDRHTFRILSGTTDAFAPPVSPAASRSPLGPTCDIKRLLKNKLPRPHPDCSLLPVVRHLLQENRRLQRELGLFRPEGRRQPARLAPDAMEQELRRLVVETMRLSLELWGKSTLTTKAELARRSRQWSVYVNQDGWERTQGLDRYLDIVTLPENPRLRKVLSTGDFVIEHCPEPFPLRERLELALDRLRMLKSSR